MVGLVIWSYCRHVQRLGSPDPHPAVDLLSPHKSVLPLRSRTPYPVKLLCVFSTPFHFSITILC
ncbi:Uncharacterised protein [Vibrio cholerae]|nr:Uncharacterised protein [Vibrio cholerae]